MSKTVWVLSAAVLLSACSSEEPTETAAPSSTSSAATTTAAPTSSPLAPTLSPEMREQAFVTFLEGKGFIPKYATASEAVDLAGALCGRYDGGSSYEDVIGVLLAGGVSAFEAGGFEGAAVTAYCPEHATRRAGP